MDGIDSGNAALDKQLQNWLAWDLKGSDSYLKVQDLIAKKEWAILDQMMTKVTIPKTMCFSLAYRFHAYMAFCRECHLELQGFEVSWNLGKGFHFHSLYVEPPRAIH
jgi:hypothetical protein